MKHSLVLLFGALLAIAADLGARPAPLSPPVAEIRDALRAGKVEAAVDASQRAVEQQADDAAAWWWAGRAYGQQAMRANVLMMPKWASRTRDAFQKAVELNPSHVDARLDLMSFYLMAPSIMGGGRDKAEAQAKAIAGLDASMGKVAEARLAGADEQPERAAALHREALALDPDNRHARQGLAGAAAQRKDWEALRALWQQALERGGPDAPYAQYQLGRTAAISGEQLEQGLAHLDSYIAGQQDPDIGVPAAHWRRGQILDKLGRRAEAIASIERALVDEAIREQAEADLERLRK